MKTGKLIAPIVITVLLVLYLAGSAALTLAPAVPLPVKLFGGGLFLALIGVSVYVLRERIQEIRGGESDDLGKY